MTEQIMIEQILIMNIVYCHLKMAIAKRIRNIMLSRGMSVPDLSEATSMNKKCICRFLRGRENFCFETFSRILGALQMSLKEFFDSPEFEDVVPTLAVEQKMVNKYFEAMKAERMAKELAEASANNTNTGI